ncbi:MAG TPA: hypothetical protein PLJ25_05145 [Methanothrix sp.]|nr:hypothetical protein [Methanothrix sp.]
MIIMMIMAALQLAAGACTASLSDLKEAISSFDDPRMSAEDLAFYLATHGFDARPEGSQVKVNLGASICKLTPNGSDPGLGTII